MSKAYCVPGGQCDCAVDVGVVMAMGLVGVVVVVVEVLAMFNFLPSHNKAFEIYCSHVTTTFTGHSLPSDRWLDMNVPSSRGIYATSVTQIGRRVYASQRLRKSYGFGVHRFVCDM